MNKTRRILKTPAGIATAFTFIVTILFIAWLLTGTHDATLQLWASTFCLDLPLVFYIYFAAKMILRRNLEPRLKRSWTLLTLGVFSVFIAESIYNLSGRPLVSIADAFFLGFYALAIPGVLLFPFLPVSRRERLMLRLDVAAVILASLVLLWYFMVNPVQQWAAEHNYAALANLIYPIGDLLLMATAVTLIQRDVRGLHPGTLLGIGLANGFVAAADAMDIFASLKHLPVQPDLSSALFMAGRFLLLPVIAYQLDFLDHPDADSRILSARFKRFLRVALPYAACGVTLLLSAVVMQSADTLELPLRGVLFGTFGLTGIVLLRQHLMLRENMDLRGIAEKDRQEIEQAARERVLAEQKVLLSEERFQIVARATNDVVWDWDALADTVQWNESILTLLGHSPEEMEPGVDSWSKRIHPEDRDRVLAGVYGLIEAGGEYWTDEYRFEKKDGSYADILDRGFVIREAGGKAVRMVGAMMNITQRKRAEKALRESEERYRTLFEESQDAVYIASPDGKFADINHAGIALFGYSSKEEILALNIVHNLCFNLAERESYDRMIAQQGFVKDFELTLKTKDGRKLSVLETSIAVKDSQGKIIAYRGIMRDVTRLKELQQDVLQLQKIDAVGRLAGGIAHDFNNLLMAIGSHCELLNLQLPQGDPLRRDVREIQNAATHGASLTQQLLAFGRKQVLTPKVLDLNLVIANIHNMLRRLIGEDVEVQVVPAPGLGFVKVDPTQMEQVLINLAVNARDAMPEGGRLILETRNVELDDEHTLRLLGLKAGPYAMVAVSDTGQGMDRETADHLFEPFFTTKETGQGTGLGLSTVYGIVKQSGGHIMVDSEPGHGTTFRMYFPRVNQDPAEKAARYAGPAQGARGETVLLVDDNESVRKAIGALLELKGFEVLQANDGPEAVEVSQRNPEAIDLLITDVVMPRMSGIELARRLREKSPQLKTLYMSGYSEEVVRKEGGLDAGTGFVSKPASMETLLLKIREIIDS